MSAALAEALAASPYPTGVRLRCSTLKAMSKSPLHCMHALLNPYEPSVSQRLGLGAHSLILGGPPIAVYPGKVRRGKEYDAFGLEHANDLILTESEAQTAEDINAAVRAHPVASRVLFQPGAIYEDTIEWDWMDRPFRCTPDARTDRILIDLKTTKNAEPEALKRDAIKYGYHAQLALYGLAMESVNGFKPRSSYIVAVESKAPYPVTVLELTPRAIDEGAQLCRTWLEAFKACEASGNWSSGYADGLVEFDVLDGVMDALDWGDDDEETSNEKAG